LYDIYEDPNPKMTIKKSTQCFRADTRILTEKGYVAISEIKVGDRVLTKDSGFQSVKTIFKNSCEGLLEIKADAMDDLYVTEEHPVFTYGFDRNKYRYAMKGRVFDTVSLKPASECKQGDFLIHPLGFPVEEKYWLDILKYSENVVDTREDNFRVKNGQRYLPKRIPMDQRAGVMFGFFLSEGHARKLKTNIGFSFHEKETGYAEEVTSYFASVFGIIPAVYYGKDTCIRISLNDRALHSLFREMGSGSYDRRPLPEFYNGTDEFFRGLLYGIFCGDGRIKQRQVSLHIKSKELLYFTKWILSHFGYVSRVSGDCLYLNSDAGRFIHGICKMPHKGSYTRSIVLDDHIATRIKKIRKVCGQVTVYNLEVENDHTYIANGYVVHNCGVSEYLIVRSTKRAMNGKSILYLLPTFQLKNQFVQERVNKTVMFTGLYRLFQAQYTGKFAESLSIKQFGTGTIVYSGSNTPNAFISYPADDIIVDEVDQCDQDLLYMAEERQSASTDKTTIKVGNPTYSNYGIDYEFEKTDKKQWVIKHGCGHEFMPDFFRHVARKLDDGRFSLIDKAYRPGMKRDILAYCDKCNQPFDRHGKGRWVPQAISEISGYHISKMFSTSVTLKELLNRFEEGLKNDAALQRFYNGDLGLAYTIQGARIDRAMLDACVRPYNLPDGMKNPCIAGIDVGMTNNVMIAEILDDRRLRLVYAGTIKDGIDILRILKQFNVRCFVIDALPETRMSKKIISNHSGGFMAYYTVQKNEFTVGKKDRIISTDRTMALDAVKECLMREMIEFPQNAASIDGLYEQIGSSTRVFDNAKQKYDWLHGSAPDHYLHSSAYLLMANRLYLHANKTY
jgi:intein/homing endonuclease